MGTVSGYPRLENIAIDVGRLLGDRCKRHCHDDAPQAVLDPVPDRKGHRRARLAATGGNRQTKDAAPLCSLLEGRHRGTSRRMRLTGLSSTDAWFARTLVSAPEICERGRAYTLWWRATQLVGHRVKTVGIN